MEPTSSSLRNLFTDAASYSKLAVATTTTGWLVAATIRWLFAIITTMAATVVMATTTTASKIRIEGRARRLRKAV